MNVSNIQEATIMAQTKEERKAAIKAAVKKSQEKTDAIMLRPPLEEGQRIRDAASKAGKKVSPFILEAVNEYMARPSGSDSAQETVEVSVECVVSISPEMYAKAQMSANYRKMSIREYVELSINEQRMKDVREVQEAAVKNKK